MTHFDEKPPDDDGETHDSDDKPEDPWEGPTGRDGAPGGLPYSSPGALRRLAERLGIPYEEFLRRMDAPEQPTEELDPEIDEALDRLETESTGGPAALKALEEVRDALARHFGVNQQQLGTPREITERMMLYARLADRADMSDESRRIFRAAIERLREELGKLRDDS